MVKTIRRSLREKGGGATDWLGGYLQRMGSSCMELPFANPTVSWVGKPKSAFFVACLLANGAPVSDEMRTPVRTCSTHRCVNGHHLRWGTAAEAMRMKRVPRRDGAHNPKAKLDADTVMQLRSITWKRTGRVKLGSVINGGRTSHFKQMVCQCLEIKKTTLDAILRGHSWPDVQYEEGMWLGDTREEVEGDNAPIRYNGRPYWLDEGYKMQLPSDWEFERVGGEFPSNNIDNGDEF